MKRLRILLHSLFKLLQLQFDKNSINQNVNMKKIINLFVITIWSLALTAQTNSKSDILLKLNGDELIGHVIEMNDADIKFVHEGETLVYAIKKVDIMKITFASGRIEFFNKPTPPSLVKTAADSNTQNNISGPGEHHNKVAILPFKYIIDRLDAGEEMTYKVQTEAYSFLKKHIGMLELQDPNTTNALLIKAGVNSSNIRGYTMGEICNMLGVEFVLQGTVTQNRTSASTYSSSSGSYKTKSNADNKGNAIGSIFGSSGSASSSTVSSSSQNYQSSITMNVYNDKGDNLFSKDHVGVWSTNDAYKITLQYLLKKTPIYKK